MNRSPLAKTLTLSIVAVLFHGSFAVAIAVGLCLRLLETGPDNSLVFGIALLVFFLYFACRHNSQVRGCFRDWKSTPARRIGRVSSKYKAVELPHLLMIDGDIFPADPLQYQAVQDGDIVEISYWRDSQTIAAIGPYAPPSAWPADVIRLARALRLGEMCAFALRDALLDAGYPELADQCRDNEVPSWLLVRQRTLTQIRQFL